MKKGRIRIRDIGKQDEGPLLGVTAEDLMPLPHPLKEPQDKPVFSPMSENQRQEYEHSLDGVSAINLPRPRNKEEEERLVESFLEGLKKLLSRNDNWTFWQPLVQSLESCVRCQTCSEACPIYLSSGKQEIYRPTYRSEVLRRLINRYVKKRRPRFLQTAGQ